MVFLTLYLFNPVPTEFPPASKPKKRSSPPLVPKSARRSLPPVAPKGGQSAGGQKFPPRGPVNGERRERPPAVPPPVYDDPNSIIMPNGVGDRYQNQTPPKTRTPKFDDTIYAIRHDIGLEEEEEDGARGATGDMGELVHTHTHTHTHTFVLFILYHSTRIFSLAHSSHPHTLTGSLQQPLPGPLDPLPTQHYFHGRISRVEAEGLLEIEGEFLVRESTKIMGQFVLTGMAHSEPQHLLLMDKTGKVCVHACVRVCVYQRVQGKCLTNKATPTRTTPFSKEKGVALGGTRTHDTLHAHLCWFTIACSLYLFSFHISFPRVHTHTYTHTHTHCRSLYRSSQGTMSLTVCLILWTTSLLETYHS